MLEIRTHRTSRWRTAAAAGALLGLTVLAAPAAATVDIDPDADKVLRSMSDYLGGLSAFSVDAEVDDEYIDLDGQKLQMPSAATLVVERPGKLYANRRTAVADFEMFFDGKTLTLNGKNLKLYAQIESPGTIDHAIDTLRGEAGIEFPAGDLFYAKPYDGLVSDVTKGVHLGMTSINGVECHHLAFRTPRVDWQLWVQAGNVPLPLRYVLTTKWMTGAPQYTARFHNWNTNPQIAAGRP